VYKPTVTIKPLPQKHYYTELEVKYEDGSCAVVHIFDGYTCGGSIPSDREIDSGWEPEFGTDHVESATVYETALLIKESLEGKH